MHHVAYMVGEHRGGKPPWRVVFEGSPWRRSVHFTLGLATGMATSPPHYQQGDDARATYRGWVARCALRRALLNSWLLADRPGKHACAGVACVGRYMKMTNPLRAVLI